ncbi:glycosyltransferase [Polynucleobacter ibericus]|uniref:glycosyltransferase n=1 Tax=Polynucleobacter ibericus TaxID=1819725 RepID=UPI001BFCEE0A|nr:glycosyltransferase [Polynucleobacter ibericus]QWE08967.1 glycosyltransferase [Polynucleobacter ibericus]
MPRILHLIPTLAGGGAERQLAMLAQEQSKCGWEVHIGVRRGGVHLATLKSGGVNVHYLGDFRSVDPRLFMNIHKLIKSIRPAIVQTWLPQMDVIGGVVALLGRVKWVGTERSSTLGINDNKFITAIRKYIFQYADAIVANSVVGKNYWQKKLPNNAYIFHVGNAVDVQVINNTPSKNIDAFTGGNKFILVVGRLHHLKAVDVSIQAISLLPGYDDLKLIVIGEGPMQNELEDLIETLGLKDRVSVLPYETEWWGILKHASALISMSRCEGSPNVVLEAMALECPLIVSDIPEHREILDQDTAVFTPVDDSLGLSHAIRGLLIDLELGKQRACLAKNRVNKMSIHAIATAYGLVYKKLRNLRA